MATLEFTTEKSSEERVINWKIQNFAQLQETKSPKNEGTTLKFTAGESLKQPSIWGLEVKFTKTQEIGLYLYLEKGHRSGKGVHAQFRASIKGPSSKQIAHNLCSIREYSTSQDGWGWNKFVAVEDLKAGGALINDTLIIQVEMVIYGEEKVKNVTPACTHKMLTENSLNDFKQLLKTGECSDFVIRVKDLDSNGYIEKKVHRAILSVRSTVFKTMLEAEMSEKGTGVVTIVDLTPKGLDVLLEFIYTGNIPDDWKLVPEEILNAAEKYNFPIIKDYIDERLHTVCTTDNAYVIYNLAKKVGLCKASKNILEYMKSNLEHVLSGI